MSQLALHYSACAPPHAHHGGTLRTSATAELTSCRHGQGYGRRYSRHLMNVSQYRRSGEALSNGATAIRRMLVPPGCRAAYTTAGGATLPVSAAVRTGIPTDAVAPPQHCARG